MLELKRWLAAATRGAAEVALTFPILFLIAIYGVPHVNLAYWFVLLALCYMLGFTCARLLPWNHRAIITLIAAMVAAGLFMLLLGASSAGTWVGTVCGFVLFFRGYRSLDSTWSADFPIQGKWIALALYVPMAVVFRIVEDLHPYANGLIWLGLITLAIVIFAANENRLQRETNAKGKSNIPSVIRNVNRIWTLLILFLILLIGSFGMIRSWVNEQFSALMSVLSRIFASGDDTAIKSETEGSMGPIKMPFENEIQSDSLLMKWFIIIVFILAALAFIIFLGYVLYRWGKRLNHFIGILFRWITGEGGGGLHGADSGYEDEKESLLNWKKMRGGLTNQLQSWLDRWNEREPKWSDLQDNRERVRYLYRLFINRGKSKGYDFKGYLTPKETGEDLAQWERGEERKLMGKLGQLYTQARYADDPQKFETDDLETLYQASQKS